MGLFRRTKNNNKPVIRQIIDLIPPHLIRESVRKFKTDKYCHKYKTYDQLVSLLFGQLCRCSTLEDISVEIVVSETFIKDLGLEQSQAKSTMSDGNKNRDYRVFDMYTQACYPIMGKNALRSRANPFIVEEIEGRTIKIRDSSTVCLCLGIFNWAKFRTA